jgi:CheY-like chemotaxis protein
MSKVRMPAKPQPSRSGPPAHNLYLFFASGPSCFRFSSFVIDMTQSSGIMVVDDQEDITRFLIKSLTLSYPEMEVVGFTEGAQAVEWLETHSPDVIITDLRMPECGGAEVITSAIEKNPLVPIIVISALSILEEFRSHSDPCETVHFLPKPFRFEELKKMLDRIASIEPESVIHGFRPISLLQVIQLENKSCLLDLEESGQTGTLIFQKGEVIRAETPELEGEEALFKILDFRSPMIKLFAAPPRCEFNVEKPLQELLLRYCQQVDEKKCLVTS